jgi:uroporphyrinogen decarboxylase
MTGRQQFLKALKREPFQGRVPHFELAFFLTMEAFGRVHPSHRSYHQWGQMSAEEKRLHIADIADLYLDIARRYDHGAILIGSAPGGFSGLLQLLEGIREKSGDEHFLMLHGDVTPEIPSGERMMDFSVMIYEEPEKIKAGTEKRISEMTKLAERLKKHGHFVNGFALCADYCFNKNPFFPPAIFADLVAPYLERIIRVYREMGYYTIKHTDGNIMPILDQLVDCRPDALHSLDPQGGVDLREVKRLCGDRITLIGNVNCGLLQTGTDAECAADIRRSLREGMAGGTGYIFSTSNCVYTGMPLSRYEMMLNIWRTEGIWK